AARATHRNRSSGTARCADSYSRFAGLRVVIHGIPAATIPCPTPRPLHSAGPCMANPRIYLWIAVALLLWMNLVQWNRDYGERSAPAAATTPAPAKPATDSAPPAPGASLPKLPALPSGQTP